MTYDSLGRLLTRSGPDFPADTFRYGPNGRWEAGVNANAYDSLHFDVAGRVDTVVQKVHNATFTVTYEYDSHGRVTKVSVSSNNPPYTGYTRYGYESSRGTLDTLCAEVNCVVVTRSVELLDSVLTYTPSPGTAWSLSRAFGPRHELLSQVYPASLSQFGATFARDSLGRVTRRTPTGATPTIRRYAYDALPASLGGVGCATLFGTVMWWATPFKPWEAALMSLVQRLWVDLERLVGIE